MAKRVAASVLRCVELALISLSMVLAQASLAYAYPDVVAPPADNILTADEKAWVDANPSVSIAMDTSWTPYAYTTADGEVGGIIRSILDQAAANVGLDVTYVARPTYADAIAACKDGTTQMVSGIANDNDMADNNDVNITVPYVTINYSAVTRSDKRIADLYADGASYAVAVCKGSYATMAMQRKMPSYNFELYSSNEECIDAVKSGQADVALIATYSANLYLERPAYNMLSSILIDDYTWGLCFGVNRDVDPMLIEVLNKGIQAINAGATNQAIYTGLTDAVDAASSPSDFIYENPVTSAVIITGVLLIAMLAVGLQIYRKQKTQEEIRRMELSVELAQRESAAKTDFLSQVSHELRTPLNAIIGMAYLGSTNKEVDPVSAGYFSTITHSGEYLRGIINDVLEARRIESGAVELSRTWCNPNDLMEDCHNMMAPQYAEKGVELIVKPASLDGQQVQIRIDGMRYSQVVMNLLSNAYKFTDADGSVTLSCQIDKVSDNTVRVQTIVADTGHGMSEEFQKKLFKPFTQEGTNAQSTIQGTGLGLSIVHGIIEVAGGEVTVSSTPGVGSTFTTTVVHEFRPDTDQPSKRKTTHPSLTTEQIDERLDGMSVLLAEDNAINATITTSLLATKGVSVTLAHNGQEALDAVRDAEPNHFDAVLMDIRMPVMGGYDATRAIRALDRDDTDTLPILAMTANALAEDLELSQEAGMDGHLSKPVDPEVLYATLADAMPSKAAN